MSVFHSISKSPGVLSVPERPRLPFLLTLEVHSASHEVATYQYQSSDLSPSTADEVERQFDQGQTAFQGRQFSASDYRGQDKHRLIFEHAGGTRSFELPLGEANVPGLYDLIQGIKARGRRL